MRNENDDTVPRLPEVDISTDSTQKDLKPLSPTDPEIMEIVNGKGGLDLQHQKFKKKEEFWALKDAIKNNDRDVVLAAVEKNGYILRYASQELRADREVVLAAVKQNGSVLQYASQELRADREVVSAAAQSFAPQPRVTEAGARVVGDAARETEGASSSGGR